MIEFFQVIDILCALFAGKSENISNSISKQLVSWGPE